MRALRYAFMLAGGYGTVAGLWIALSSAIAAGEAATVEELERFETLKGWGFVAVTAVLLFFGAVVALRRVEAVAAELRERDRTLAANERRIFAGLLASTVAHDANNVLTAVLGELAELEDSADPAVLARLSAAIHRLVELNRRLVQAGKQSLTQDLRQIDLAGTATDALTLLRRHPSLRNVTLTVASEAPAPVLATEALVSQIVVNLVLNAAEATQGQGAVRLSVTPSGAHTTLRVEDDGPGIPAERREGLFHALQTTKVNGNGVGLFSVHAAAHALNGSVEVGSSPMGGAQFTVTLPALKAPAAPP